MVYGICLNFRAEKNKSTSIGDSYIVQKWVEINSDSLHHTAIGPCHEMIESSLPLVRGDQKPNRITEKKTSEKLFQWT